MSCANASTTVPRESPRSPASARVDGSRAPAGSRPLADRGAQGVLERGAAPGMRGEREVQVGPEVDRGSDIEVARGPGSPGRYGTAMTTADPRARFAALHARPDVFVMPNPWDVGSARLLAVAGFEALATTSSGFAWTSARTTSSVTRDELARARRGARGATPLPLSVDSERLYADDPAGVAETVRLLAERRRRRLLDRGLRPGDESGIDDAPSGGAERVAAAAAAARATGLVLTARAENHLYGVDDLDDTIARLVAYRAAGADVVYAPGLATPTQIAAVVAAVDAPVNVLALPGGPPVAELGRLGVRRVSTGGALAKAAYGALMAAARELLDPARPSTRAAA